VECTTPNPTFSSVSMVKIRFFSNRFKFCKIFLSEKKILGPSSLAGVLTMIIFIPVNIYLSTKSKELQRQKLKQQDSRIKITNEILNGVKVKFFLKIYANKSIAKNKMRKGS